MAENTDIRQRIAAVCKQLGADELRVVYLISSRLLAGQANYGPLSIDTDGRNWRKEGCEEFADAAVYGSIELLKRGLAEPLPKVGT